MPACLLARVNKSLRELADSGAIRLSYGSIEVLDAALLPRACDGALQPARSGG